MLLTISTTRVPATDLGYLLHKHPDRHQCFPMTFGQASVFYPEANAEKCTAALLLDVDPVGLVRGKWYFLDHPSIPPDNNLAERSLRLAVTKRKVSGGSRSMSRFEQTADLLSVIQTCRFQGRSAMAFFRDAISAQYE